MKEKIQELYEEVSRYKGTNFITLHKLSKFEKLIEELKEESRKKTDIKDYYNINDVINHLNKSDYTILTNNGYKVVVVDEKVYVKNYAGDMKKLTDSIESLIEDDFYNCDYILDMCENWQI